MTEVLVISFERLAAFLFFCIVGYVLYAKKEVPENATETVSRITMQVLVPLMLFNSIAQDCTINNIVQYAKILGVGIGFTILTWIISIPAGRLLGGDRTVQLTNEYSFVVPNCSYFGTPLVLALFGTEMAAKFCIFFLPMTFYVYVYTLNKWNPDQKGSGFKKIASCFKNFAVLGALSGALYGLTGLPYPTILKNIGDSASQCAGPVAMILTGMTIGRMGLSRCFTNKKAYEITFIKLIIYPIVFIPLAYLLGKYAGLGVDIVIVMGVYSILPLGLSPIIFAEDYGLDGSYGTQTALISTLGSMITVPVWMAVIMKVTEYL